MVSDRVLNLPPLYRLIEQEFGVQTTPRVTSPTIAITSSVIMRADPTRLAFGLYNLFTSAMFVNLGSEVSNINGVSIAASPGNFTMVYKEDFHMTGLEWHAISPGGNGVLLVFEILGVR